MRQVALLLFLLISSAAMACSGPGAELAMVSSEWMARAQFAYAALAVLVSLGLLVKSQANAVASIALFCLATSHPFWWISAYRGDCGGQLGMFSVAYTALSTIALCWQIRGVFKKAPPVLATKLKVK